MRKFNLTTVEVYLFEDTKSQIRILRGALGWVSSTGQMTLPAHSAQYPKQISVSVVFSIWFDVLRNLLHILTWVHGPWHLVQSSKVDFVKFHLLQKARHLLVSIRENRSVLGAT